MINNEHSFLVHLRTSVMVKIKTSALFGLVKIFQSYRAWFTNPLIVLADFPNFNTVAKASTFWIHYILLENVVSEGFLKYPGLNFTEFLKILLEKGGE